MRICGECRLCCKVFPVPVLDKPADEWCRFADSSGCSIHGDDRAAVCREYACYWLEHEDMAEELRPDRIGAVVTECGTVTVGEHELPVFLLNESDAGACRRPGAAGLVQRMVAGGAAAMVICGPDMEILYDQVRYPSISARDIEVAFRYERSQDAEELKRLGAVADDYRPLSREEAEALTRDQGLP